jgi:integrase
MKHRGQGHVFRRPGTDCWTIQYQITKDGRRVRVRESTGTANYNHARKLLNQRLAAEGRGEPIGPAVDRTTFEHLRDMLLNDYAANGRKSIGRIKEALNHLADFFGGRKAKEITQDRVTAYIAHRQKEAHRQGSGASNATINRELAALKRALNLGFKAGKVAIQPSFSLLRENNTRTGFFEPGELGAILEELPDHLKPVAEAAYISGWRPPSELLTRRWNHVDFDGDWLRLEPGETKNGKGREFPITKELRAILERQAASARAIEERTGTPVPWVFHRNDGSPIRDYYSAWRSACTRAGLDGKYVYDFRRTAVRNLERAGVPRSAVMAMTGHLTEAVYRRYATVDGAMLREAASKLEAHHAQENRAHPMTPGEIQRLATVVAKRAVSSSLALVSVSATE